MQNSACQITIPQTQYSYNVSPKPTEPEEKYNNILSPNYNNLVSKLLDQLNQRIHAPRYCKGSIKKTRCLQNLSVMLDRRVLRHLPTVLSADHDNQGQEGESQEPHDNRAPTERNDRIELLADQLEGLAQACAERALKESLIMLASGTRGG